MLSVMIAPACAVPVKVGVVVVLTAGIVTFGALGAVRSSWKTLTAEVADTLPVRSVAVAVTEAVDPSDNSGVSVMLK